MFLGLTAVSPAADTLQEARVRIAMADPVTCDVTASFAVALDRGGDIEQRLQRLEGSGVHLLGITGVEQSTPPRTVGVTEVLVIRFPSPGTHRYEIRYRVTQPDEWAYRCPVWLPAIPADGRSRNVMIEVTLPPAALPAGGAFPGFEWEDGVARAVLGNVPAFIRLPFTTPGQASPAARDLGRIMDIAAVGVLVAGTALWAARRRR